MVLYRGLSVGALIAAVTLAGCTSETKPQAGNAAAHAPTVSWDGNYRGIVRVTGLGSGVQSKWCETDPQFIVQVTGNSFTYAMPHPNVPHNPTPVYSAVIAPDGTFRTEMLSGMMAGQVVGRRMSGTINGSACVYAFSADRS